MECLGEIKIMTSNFDFSSLNKHHSELCQIDEAGVSEQDTKIQVKFYIEGIFQIFKHVIQNDLNKN